MSVDACLSYGLKRRALALFKTSMKKNFDFINVLSFSKCAFIFKMCFHFQIVPYSHTQIVFRIPYNTVVQSYSAHFHDLCCLHSTLMQALSVMELPIPLVISQVYQLLSSDVMRRICSVLLSNYIYSGIYNSPPFADFST